MKLNHYVHGEAKHSKQATNYHVWRQMMQRCLNPNHPSYAYYGGRGIMVCDRWRESYKNFLNDMGQRPEGKSLDRINNHGNYEPGNCRWATRVEQQNNKRASWIWYKLISSC